MIKVDLLSERISSQYITEEILKYLTNFSKV